MGSVSRSSSPPRTQKVICDALDVELDDLPHPDDVAADLALLVHSLERFPALRLLGLDALPSVRDWRPPGRSKQHSEQERRALAIEYVITDVIEVHPHSEAPRLGLLTFGDRERPMKDRQEDAAEALGLKSGDSFRKSRESGLLRALADNIYRHELLHSVRRYDSIRDSARMGATWWRTVELDWAVTVTAERPNEQLWQFRHILHCMTSVSLPMFVIILPWTGTGPHRPETVKAISGPSLRIRRLSLLILCCVFVQFCQVPHTDGRWPTFGTWVRPLRQEMRWS